MSLSDNDANEYYAVNGVIDDVRLWSVARTGAQISAGNCADPCAYGGGCAADLVHFWKFDESFGSTIS
eukprot:COSAG03_NODE_1118_length_4781_cov_2.790474_1_plen_67_part_10